MNASIRKVALALGIAFVALVANLHYVQLARSDDLAQDSRNKRRAFEEEGIRRGEILAADNTLLATSKRTRDEQFLWRRVYPEGSLFGQITGYYTSPLFCQSEGIEKTQNDYLTGEEPRTAQDFVDELLGRPKRGNSLKLTIFPKLQKLAQMRFGSQRGGAAVIDARNGAVLALYGTNPYDPNEIAKPARTECSEPKNRIDRHPLRPFLSRAYQVRYPAGSTYKIITMAAALESKRYTNQTYIPVRTRLDLPNTNRTLGNFGGSTCGGSLKRSLEVSCNTAFAQVALRVGLDRLADMSTRFGLNEGFPFDLEAITSCIASQLGRACAEPNYGNAFPPYVGIGQQSVGVTPLQMAMVAGVVANGGVLMRPRVVARVLDHTNATLIKTKPEVLRRVYSKKTAEQMRAAMLAVVCSGTGRVVGFKGTCSGVGGKTGTAQTAKGRAPHVWFVAFQGPIAVAVVVENGGSLASEATGGKVAGPIAKALLEYALEKRYHG